jgi:hypothetical protein
MLAIKTPSPWRRSSPTRIDLLEAAQEGNLSAKAGKLEVPGQGLGAEAATEVVTVTKVLVTCSEVANAVAEAAREAVREAAREEDIEVTREVTKEEDIEEDTEVPPEIALMVEMEEIEVLRVADLPDSMMTRITITDLLSREGMAVVVKVQGPEITTKMMRITTMRQGLDHSSNQGETTAMVDSSLLVVTSQVEDIEIGLKRTTMIDHLLADSNLPPGTLLGSSSTSMMTPPLTQEVEEVAVVASAVDLEAEEALPEVVSAVEEAVNKITKIIHDERYKLPK